MRSYATGNNPFHLFRVGYEFPDRRKGFNNADIGDIYDPQEVEQRHLTCSDEEIKMIDVPERYQTLRLQLQHAEESQLEEEAKWIYENLFRNQTVSIQTYVRKDLLKLNLFCMKSRLFISKIKSVLDFIRNRHYDLMFIACYRKEHIYPEITTDDLYWILKFDDYWNQMLSKKESLLTLTRKLQNHLYETIRLKPDAILNDELRIIQDEDIRRIDKASSNEDLNDISHLLFLYYGQEMVIMRNNTISKELDSFSKGNSQKHSSRRNYYSVCKHFGLNSLASKFGMTPEQLGENLRESYQVHEPEQFPVEPDEASQEYIQINTPFSSSDSVLSGARHMVAFQIFHDPQIRLYFRSLFRKRARVFVEPTKKGYTHITERHYCAKFKYLKGKPVNDFIYDEFLFLLQAEEQDLIKIKISLDNSVETTGNINQSVSASHSFLDEIKHLYLRDDYSAVVTKWNDERTKALEYAVYNLLYPFVVKELKFLLKSEGEKHVMLKCMSKMEQFINISPSVPTHMVQESSRIQNFNKFETGFPLVSCSISSDEKIPSYVVALDSNGEVLNFTKLHFLNKDIKKNDKNNHSNKMRNMQLLKDFIFSSKANLIVLPASTKLALDLQEDLKKLIDDLIIDESSFSASIEIFDSCLANISSQSNSSLLEFPDYPIQLRHAISMGRRAQDPLTEFADLAINPENLLCLPLHSLQVHVSSEELTNALHFQLCKVIANVGVDINSCLKFEHKSCLLNFIPGLGPRKASAILKKLQQDGSILENRSQLITICEVGPTVFLNCAAFIKVDVNDIREKGTDSYIEDLDASRVHPETYDWAKKMAVDALEYDDTTEDFDSTEAVQRILRNPDRLRELDLDAFAVQLEKENFGDKRSTLYDIRNELELGCFRDRRKPSQILNKIEIFELIYEDHLTNDFQKDFNKGNIINCEVKSIVRKKISSDQYTKISPERSEETGKWKCPFCKSDFVEFSLFWVHCDEGLCPGEPIGIRTILENGLIGFIHMKNLSSHLVLNPENRVRIGMTVTCRILDVNYDNFTLILSSKSTDLQDSDKKFTLKKDKYYNFEKEREDLKNEISHIEKNQISSIRRVLVHPKFRNVTYQESLPILEKLSFGDCIIRPSSRGMNRLTLSWKVANSVYQHFDIIEKNKPNEFSIGKSLWINEQEYEDLDEIMAIFLNKMVIFLKELRVHKCFREPIADQKPFLEKKLLEEKKINSSRIPYLISPSINLPGKFILAYTPKNKVQFDYFSINPQGLKYRGQLFDSFSQLLKWFKDHYIASFNRKPNSQLANSIVKSPILRHSNIGFGYNPNISKIHSEHQKVSTISRAKNSHS